jgi:hypothetical protein
MDTQAIIPTHYFTTLKAAYAAGYRDAAPDDYGVPVFSLKGHQLVHNPKQAVSRTAWEQKGFRVRIDAEPHAIISGRYQSWAVFRDDQVEPRRRLFVPPPKQIPILAAVWAINRHAKRLRNRASAWWEDGRRDLAGTNAARKRTYYRLKGQCLQYLLSEGILTVTGHVRFGSDGSLWAEIVEGDGYSFHRPCAPVEGAEVPQIHRIEAKPKKATEPRLRDAELTIRNYLKERPEVAVYEWPPRVRPTRLWWVEDDDERDDECENENEYEDGWC